LFVSPDGQWIGFRDGLGVLKKVAVAGGPAITLATIDTAGRPRIAGVVSQERAPVGEQAARLALRLAQVDAGHQRAVAELQSELLAAAVGLLEARLPVPSSCHLFSPPPTRSPVL
jgi:hypothetical protein